MSKKPGYTKKLNFIEWLYLPILKGMSVTLKHFFRKKVTIRYPEEQPVLPPRYRGRPTLKRNENDIERCTACKLCELACPANAIKIVPEEVPLDQRDIFPSERRAKVWELDMLRCIYCGMCEEACPCAAIFLEDIIHTSVLAEDKTKLILNKEDLLEASGGPVKFVD